ncbi:MAG: type IV toxin-antitoxin system AbiEi family antitoxin domain-containing protein [Methylacidiphilales bacterium]|nr:type IV toxin-antitoxin system AbiEi family antitoxin domain-containing protein [Candidatus Methylacidiphilales bacterium]
MEKKLKKGDFLDTILRSPLTIFSTKYIALLWGQNNDKASRERLRSYVKSKKLLRLRRGIYAKDKKYNEYELANTICTPSYISFETVLAIEGVVFQYYSNIFVASYINREIVIHGQKITFIRMKNEVLKNTKGIEQVGNYAMASKERAFLDRMYVNKKNYFDNLYGMNWDKVFDLLPIYKNKKMEKTVKEYREDCRKEYDI